MKQTEIIVLGLAGLAVYLIMKSGQKPAAASTWRQPYKVDEILSGDGSRYNNGWRYFSDGTSISPDGTYYMNGQFVWSPGT